MRLFLLLLLSSSAIISAEESTKQVVAVTVKSLSQVLVERKLSAVAETVALNHSSIASENTALIESIDVDVGQMVKQGQILLELDDTDFYLSVKQAQANLSSNQAQIKQAELRLKRAEELIEKKYIADDDFLARQTELIVLNAESRRLKIAVEQANRALSKTKIKAPFDAIVNKRYAQVGSLVTHGQNLFELVQFKSPEVIAKIPEHLSDSLNQASEISFNDGQQSYALKLITLSPVVDKSSRVQMARFEFTSDFMAKIGSSGEVVWKLDNGLIPADMIIRRGGQLGIFIVNGDSAKFVVLHRAQEGRPVAFNALKLSETSLIIVGGRERLQDGDLIKVKR